MITKKETLEYFAYPCAQGFHSLMVNAEEYKKSNFKKLFKPLSLTVLKLLISWLILLIKKSQEA